jgi:hypothetical protein
MGTTVSVQQPTLRVDPGSTVSTELRVRNTGLVVDQFSFQPLGDAAAWIKVEPPTVRLFPETDAVVTVTIAPPREPSSRPGVAHWGVKAVPQEDPAGAAVGEGTVDVGTFVEVSAELQPTTGRGRMTGRFELAVDNRGNVPVPVRIHGTDPEQSLGFEVEPAAIDSQPGSAHFAKLAVRPAAKIWRGQPKTHPFQVVVEPQARTGPPVEADSGVVLPPPVQAEQPVQPIVLTGTLLQEPIIPKWLLKALLLLLALLLALFILWKTLLKPSVESAARDVAIEEIAPVSSAVAQLEPAVEEASQQAAAAEEAAAGAEEAAAAGGGGGGEGGGGGALGNLFNSTTQPTNFRVAVDAGVGTSNSASGPVVDPTASFALTDVIFQNPGGDFGRISIIINGQPVLVSALENFRDLDFHFVAPYVVPAGQAITVQVDCATTQIDARATCSDAISFAGFTTTVTPATTAPVGG